MGDLNDFQGFSQTFRNERESLKDLTKEGRIDQDDHDEIDRFTDGWSAVAETLSAKSWISELV